MLLAEHTLAALERAPVERQSPRRVAQRLQAVGQIVHAGERLQMLLAEHPLAAFERAPWSGKAPAASPSAFRQSARLFTLASVSGCSLPSTRSQLSSARR
jgi:hypothetical protein